MLKLKKTISTILCVALISAGAITYADGVDPNQTLPLEGKNMETAPETYTIEDSDAQIIFNNEPMVIDVGLKKLVNSKGEDTNLVPIRKVAELLNCAVAWRSSDKTVHIFKNGESKMFAENVQEVVLHKFEIGAKFVYTDKPDVRKIEGYPINNEGRVLIPVRAVLEIFGAKDDKNAKDAKDDKNAKGVKIDYDEKQKIINISVDEEVLGSRPSIADIKAANLIETYNYKPEQIKNANVNINISFEGADLALSNGIAVTLDGKTQTTDNGGVCTFEDIDAGTYTLTFDNVPEGYVIKATTVVVEEGKDANVSLLFEKSNEDDKNDNSNSNGDKAKNDNSNSNGDKAKNDNSNSNGDKTKNDNQSNGTAAK